MFGWGKKSLRWKIENGKWLLVTWEYFHVFYCPIAFGAQWYVQGESRSDEKEISYSKVKEMFPTNTPKISLWQRYGLILATIGVIIGAQLLSLSGR